MKVNAVEQTRSPAGKLRVRLEDGSSLLLMPTVVGDFGLYAGAEVEERLLKEIRRANAAASAKNRAVRIVSAAAVTRGELEKRLVQKGETPEDAKDAVRWLEELKLVDDRQVAQQVVRSGAARGYGAARIRQMLYAKGVPREYWEEALEALPEQADAIDDFLRRRFRGRQPDRNEWKKAADALLRRGHSWDDIRSGLERYAPEEEFFDE